MIVQKYPTAQKLRKGDRTKAVILDAAEREFATYGFNAVSMRHCADSAGQLVGVLTYHFPTKESLFEAVVTRRAEELTALRRAAMASLISPTLEDLLHAFLGPFLDRMEFGDPGWKAYAQILAHIAQEARWAPLVGSLFGDASRTFVRRMREAEPGVTLDAATRGYVQLVAVMVGLFAATGLLDRLSNGRLSSDDIAANYEPTIRFLAGGLRACAKDAPDASAAARRRPAFAQAFGANL